MFNQIIICEGTHDEQKIKTAYPEASCIITNGSEISQDTLTLIKALAEKHEIIIFTDPDFPGERIRNRVMQVVPNAKHAFIKKHKCISENNKKVGVEHATVEDIKEALSSVYTPCEIIKTIKMSDLTALGLTGSALASKKREKISQALNIGTPNAKTFINRLTLFGITLEDLRKLVGEIDE